MKYILIVTLWLLALPGLAWSAIEYVGAQTGTTAGTTTAITANFALTGGSAAVPAAGDLVVVTWCVGSTVDASLSIANTSTTNYTLIGSELFGNDANTTNMRVAYRFMPTPTETQVVFSETVSGGTGRDTDAGAYNIFVLRNVYVSPLEQAAQQGTASNTRLVDPGSITPTTSGTYIYVAGCSAEALGGTFTSSDLTDFRATTQVDTTDVNIGAGYLAWAAGAFSPATFGAGGTDTTNDSNAWTIVAFTPDPPAGSAISSMSSGWFVVIH